MKFQERRLEFLKMFNKAGNYLSGREVVELSELPIKHVYKLLSYYHNQGLLNRSE